MNSLRPVLLFIYIISVQLTFGQTMRVHVINVGQGSATILEFPCGVILVDTGGEKNDLFDSDEEILEYLDTFFSNKPELNNTIDLLMISHPHIDHTRGIKDIFEKYIVKNAISNGQEEGSGKHDQIFLHRTISIREATPETSDDIGFMDCYNNIISSEGLTNNVIDPINCPHANPEIKLLWGRADDGMGWGYSDFTDENNHSVVARVDFGESSILLTGDLEIIAINDLLDKYKNSDILDVDVYLAGHHGSWNGSTPEFINAMSPEISILSFGDMRRQRSWTAYDYGHPNVDIVNLLRTGVTRSRPAKEVWVGDGPKNFYPIEISEAVYGTGWDGDIVLEATLDGVWTNITEPLGEETHITRINVNTAGQEKLETLPSIGISRAKAIIEYRERNGNFEKAEDLDKVPGIGPATITGIKNLITF